MVNPFRYNVYFNIADIELTHDQTYSYDRSERPLTSSRIFECLVHLHFYAIENIVFSSHFTALSVVIGVSLPGYRHL